MKDQEFWDDDAILKDLLFNTNLPVTQIAKELDWTQAQTSKRIKQLGLSWVKRNNRKLSRGHAALTEIMKRLLPGEEVINEHSIGERLLLDIFVPGYNLAAEYHGRQHFFYSNLFHKDKYDFEESKRRDERKIELCIEKGITLVVFRFNDSLDEQVVFERLLDAIRTSEVKVPEKKKPSIKGNPYYERAKQQKNEYNRQRYRELKKKRKNADTRN